MAKSYSSIKPFFTSQKAKENWSGKKKAYKDIAVKDYDFSLEDGYIQSFQSDLQGYVKDAEKDYAGMEYGNAGDLYSQYSQKGLDLQNRARNIRAYLNANRQNIDEGDYTALIKDLGSFDTLFEDTSTAFRKKSEEFAAFDTQWDYYGHLMNESGSGTDAASVNGRHNAYTASKARLEEIEKELVALTDARGVALTAVDGVEDIADIDEKARKAKEEKEKILSYVRQYERQGKKDKDEAFLSNATKADYAEKSANREFYNATKEDFDEFDTKAYGGYVLNYDSGESTYVEADPLFDTEENRKKLVINDPLGFYLKLKDPTRNAEHDGDTVSYSPTNISTGTAYQDVYSKGDKFHWENLEDDEIGMYYYILGEQGTDAALSFLETMEYELANRETEDYREYLRNAPLDEVAFANLLSVGGNLAGNVSSFATDMMTLLSGKEYKPYGLGYDLRNQSQAARGIAAEELDAATGGKKVLGISAGDTYQALMSGVDSYVGAKLFGKASLPVMSAGAASATVKELYESGASEQQILNGAAIAFGAEWLGEKIPLDEFFKTKGSTDSLVKLFLNTAKQGGFEMVGESVTEIANIFGEAINLHSESEWAKILKENDGAFMDTVLQIGKEKVWPAAAGGFISGSAMGGAQGVVDYARNRSARTAKNTSPALTENEQKVVDKVVADRIAEAEKDGKTLTKKEKTAIEAAVQNEMERGAISTDTIEEVLGGDTYKAYKDTVDSEEALQKEFDGLRTMKAGDMTIEQQDRYRELKQQIEDTKGNSSRASQQEQLSREVSELVKGDRLAESYNEKARRSQPFTADLSRYSEKERATVQKAIDSGVLNNTNRTHELVDLIAKVSADKDIAFDFADNAKLKESGFALEGRTVNGFVTDAGVTVNVNSAKALNSVVGHEITHVLEGTELYSALQTALFDYAKAKGDYQGRYDAVAELYKDVKGANIEAELTADLVGDYLFTDSEFVKRLSTEHRNVFEKIYDEVKYLCKVVTAGSKEARQLEKVKKAFEEAYKADGAQNNTAEGGVRYSVSETTDAPKITANMTDTERAKILQNKTIDAPIYRGEAETVIASEKDLRSGKRSLAKAALVRIGEEFNVFTDYSIEDVDVQISLSRSGLRESISKDANPIQLARLLPVLKETVENAVGIESHDNRYFYDNTTESFDNLLGGYIDGEYFVPVRFGLKHIRGGETVLYVVVDQQKIEAEVIKATTHQNDGSAASRSTSTYSIPQVVSLVNSKDLLRYLPDDMLTVNQKQIKREGIAETVRYTNDKNDAKYAKFIADGNTQAAQSMVDEAAKAAGYTIKAYHGTTNRQEKSTWNQNTRTWDTEYRKITVFKRQYSEQAGHFFNSDMDNAGGYGSDLYPVYLMLKKPLVIDCKGQNYASITFDGKEMDTYEWAAYARKQRYDGVVFENISDGVDYSDLSKLTTDYVVFDSNRIKSAEPVTYDNDGNIIPLSQRFKAVNNDIRYSLSSDDIAPIKGGIYGKDVALEGMEDDARSAPTDEAESTDSQQSAMAAFRYFDGLTEESGLHNTYTVNGIDITLQIGLFGGTGKYKVYTEFFNGDRHTSWAIPQSFDTLEEAKTHAEMLAFDAAEYVAGEQTPFELYWQGAAPTQGAIAENAPMEDIGPVREAAAEQAEFEGVTEYGPVLQSSARGAAAVAGNTSSTASGPPSPQGEGYRGAAPGEGEGYASSSEGGYVAVEDIGPVREDMPIRTVKERLAAKLENSRTELANVQQKQEEAHQSYDSRVEALQAEYEAKKDKATKAANDLLRRIERLQRLQADVDADYAKRVSDIEAKITKTEGQLQEDHTKADRLEGKYQRIDNRLAREKEVLAAEFKSRREVLAEVLADKDTYISNTALALYRELQGLKKGVRASSQLGYLLDHGYEWRDIKTALLNVKNSPGSTVDMNSAAESVAREILAEDYESGLYELDDLDAEYQRQVEELETEAQKQRAEARKEEQTVSRKELHRRIVEKIRSRFAEKGFDLDAVLDKAKDLSTFSTVDNTPQRVMEKALGYKEGQVLADLTVNQVAQNETEGIRWLNSFTDRKSGVLAQISKRYGIKPGSKESAAAQMYAEGFYVDQNNDIVEYGDRELAKDFPDRKVQENIKGLAKDPRIRQIYDETLASINEARVRNGYAAIPRLDNYFLHFRAMSDTFSKLGLPFNPNDIRAKDLPTDLNGVTADLKPGKPFFASAMHRRGQRTSFDLLGGLEQYLSSAKNQIYHIDDIQTLRALRNHIADTYGQASGLEDLDALTEEEAQERIEQVYKSHLSTFAKFLNEEANVLAGKTALIDRGLEGIIGRRGITFLETVNRQVGSNMVGFNVSSSLTNIIPVVQTFAKTNKFDFLKAFAQTVSNRMGSVHGRGDTFAEESPVIIRRKGADRFHRTAWQKVGDAGYVLMSAVDDVSTEIIARTKFNELTRKGMDEQQAHFETDKWVSRLMGDRSLGQQPQLYNSKMLGLVTKFQLEVRNQLDSQFYDTVQEAKVSTEDIQNGLERNAKRAAKVGSTLFQLAVAQHLFGMAFEAVAGYNPAFDIVEALLKVCGFDDDEDSEDTALDNIEQGFLVLMEDLPYVSTFTGGRVPIQSALPIKELVYGEDQYGNEKSRLETLGEVAPYYVLPGGYGQIKKTVQGLGMFDDDLPIKGSYTDSGKLRFPVKDTFANRVQAGLFGQWASEEAREYFEED